MKLTKRQKQINNQNKEMMGIFKDNCQDSENFDLVQRKKWQKMAKILKEINTALLFFSIPNLKKEKER